MNKAVNAITLYLKGVRSEWGKVNWPERQQVFGETFAVVVIVFVFTVAVYVLDVVFKWLVTDGLNWLKQFFIQ